MGEWENGREMVAKKIKSGEWTGVHGERGVINVLWWGKGGIKKKRKRLKK